VGAPASGASALAAELSARGAPSTVTELQGPPEEALAAAADDADLLVVGSRERGPEGALLLGETALGLLHRATVPVVVLPRA
jgi:nucleotide-binding universal stress UspA family protein